ACSCQVETHRSNLGVHRSISLVRIKDILRVNNILIPWTNLAQVGPYYAAAFLALASSRLYTPVSKKKEGSSFWNSSRVTNSSNAKKSSNRFKHLDMKHFPGSFAGPTLRPTCFANTPRPRRRN